MQNKRSRRIIAAILLIAGILFGCTINRWQICLGDEVFQFFGLSAWSNGTTGMHYPAFIGLILIAAGITMFNLTAKPRTRLILNGTLAALLLFVSFMIH